MKTTLLACRCKAWIWRSSKSALSHTQSLVNEVQGPEDVEGGKQAKW